MIYTKLTKDILIFALLFFFFISLFTIPQTTHAAPYEWEYLNVIDPDCYYNNPSWPFPGCDATNGGATAWEPAGDWSCTEFQAVNPINLKCGMPESERIDDCMNSYGMEHAYISNVYDCVPQPVTTTLTVTPTTVPVGGMVNVTWSSVDAVDCDLAIDDNWGPFDNQGT